MSRSAYIDRHLALLLRLLSLLQTLISEGVSQERYRRVLRLLLPAESALRRLIVLAAQDVVLGKAVKASRPLPDFSKLAKESEKGARIPSFPLFDARLYPAPPVRRMRHCPRIRCLSEPPCFETLEPAFDKGAAEKRLSGRLARFERALRNLPREAKRFVRCHLRPNAKPRRPMRPGRPPGSRARAAHWVDRLLRELHDNALRVRLDTS